MDRAYVDFERLFVFTLCSSFFVVRTKKNILLQRRYSHPVDKSTGLHSDQTVILTAIESAKAYPDPLRRVSYFDSRTNNTRSVHSPDWRDTTRSRQAWRLPGNSWAQSTSKAGRETVSGLERRARFRGPGVRV